MIMDLSFYQGFDLIHQLSENTTIGGTLINLSENPLTQKANYGTSTKTF